MKAFNSFFAIATVAISSVFGFTSCDKNDDAFNQPEPKVETKRVIVEDSYLCVPVVEGQMEYMDATYNLTVDGKSVQVKIADMTETKDAKRFNQASNGVNLAESFNDVDDKDSKDKFAVYEYNLGKVLDVKLNSIVYSSKGKLVDKEHEINFLTGCTVVNNVLWKTNSKEDCRYFKGINEFDGFLSVMNDYYRY